VGNLGIEIFQKFRAEWFGKQTIITWIEQERNKNPERPLWSVCMDTNLASYKLHASLWVHQSEYDRQHPIHPHCNILSYKF
jgi:imidazole glycerol phosphate synthase subunit HisF